MNAYDPYMEIITREAMEYLSAAVARDEAETAAKIVPDEDPRLRSAPAGAQTEAES